MSIELCIASIVRKTGHTGDTCLLSCGSFLASRPQRLTAVPPALDPHLRFDLTSLSLFLFSEPSSQMDVGNSTTHISNCTVYNTIHHVTYASSETKITATRTTTASEETIEGEDFDGEVAGLGSNQVLQRYLAPV